MHRFTALIACCAHRRRLFRHRRADRFARTAFRRAGPSERDVGLDEADGVGAEPCRLARTTRSTPNGSWRSSRNSAGTRISRNSRFSIPRRSSEAVELLGKKKFTATLQEKPIPGDTSSRDEGQAASRLSRISGRRRCHRAAGLRQLRHAGRLQGARAHGRQRQGQDRDRALRRGLARIEAAARRRSRRGRLHHLFRSRR